jgi:anthranilate synthase/aminodeoxychorismate synthase-like glutamine amidotransferase
MILLIDNYDSFTFNLYQFLAELGAEVEVVRNDKISLDEIERRLPLIERIVVSPGPCTPQEAGLSMPIIKRFGGKVPVLGVCLGHQSIGAVYGGTVFGAPQLMHGKTSKIYHGGTGVFRGLPSPFTATRYHSLIVERSSLPPVLEITAETEDGIIMGLRHRELEVEGVQFHPESILTPVGKDLLANFIGARRPSAPATADRELAVIGY